VRLRYNRLHALHIAVKQSLEDIDIEAGDRAAAERLSAADPTVSRESQYPRICRP
jgi:hypothetical protein